MLTNALILANMYSNRNSILLLPLLLSSFICQSLLCLFLVIDKEFAVKCVIPITRITSQSSFGRPILSIASAQTVSSFQSSSVIEWNWLHLLSIWSPLFILRPFHSFSLHSQWSLSIPLRIPLWNLSISLPSVHLSSLHPSISLLFYSIPHSFLFSDSSPSHSMAFSFSSLHRLRSFPFMQIPIESESYYRACNGSLHCLSITLPFYVISFSFFSSVLVISQLTIIFSSLQGVISFSALRPWEIQLIIWEGRKKGVPLLFDPHQW